MLKCTLGMLLDIRIKVNIRQMLLIIRVTKRNDVLPTITDFTVVQRMSPVKQDVLSCQHYFVTRIEMTKKLHEILLIKYVVKSLGMHILNVINSLPKIENTLHKYPYTNVINIQKAMKFETIV